MGAGDAVTLLEAKQVEVLLVPECGQPEKNLMFPAYSYTEQRWDTVK